MTLPPSGPHDDAARASGTSAPGAPGAPGAPAEGTVPQGWPPAGWPSDRRAGAAGPVPGAVPEGWPGRAPAGWPTGGGRPAAAPTWEPGRFHWGDAVVVLAYVALMILGLGLLLAMALGLVPRELDAMTVMDGFRVNILSYAILVALVLAVAWRPLVTSLRVFATGTWWKLLLLPATWFACILVNVMIFSVIGQPQTSANQAALEEMTTQAPPALMVFMTVIGAPLVEEYLFRHLLIGKLSRWVNVWVCAAVSVVAFVLLHFVGTGFRFDPVELIPYLTLAIAITVSYILMGRSYGYAVALHMVNNGIAIAVLYLLAPLLPEVGPQPVAPTAFLAPLPALAG